MASLITVRLNKADAPNWGFRLQGGKDFGTPLVVQKVNVGSPAERAGLAAGDSVIKVNNIEVYDLRHKDAQDVVMRAGNNFEMSVQRGGSTWKPYVAPAGSILSHSPVINNVSPVTQTSLKHSRQENIGAIGTGHNVSAKPFNSYNGTVNGGPKLVNKQFNSPINLYSDQSIAETLSAQAEVLSTGALGVNFKKNEKGYDASQSAVYRMLQEAENEPRTPEAVNRSDFYATHSHAIGGRSVVSPRPTPAQSTGDPTESHNQASNQQGDNPPPDNFQDQQGVTTCTDCERVIVGVFVRIKDKNLHVECFKCATCGSSLKNVGYYNINNKLYCDIHAKLAARNNPPAPNLVPVTVPPGGRAPAHAISSALAFHSSLPTPGPASPKLNSYGSQYQGNITAPRPFSSVSAPLSPPRGAPLSPVAPAPSLPSYSPVSSSGRSVQNIVWPPVQEESELPTACPLYVPPPDCLHVEPKRKLSESDSVDIYSYNEIEEINAMAQFQEPKLSLCGEEVTSITGKRSAFECIETISETLETQQFVEGILKTVPQVLPLDDQNITLTDSKRQIKSDIKSEAKLPKGCDASVCCQGKENVELKRPTQYSPNTLESIKKPSGPKVQNTVPKKWESTMLQALQTVPGGKESDDVFSKIPEKRSSSALASALSTAPAEPFTPQLPFSSQPVPLPEETEPYFPPEHPIIIEPKLPKPPQDDTEFIKALQIAPERPFTPVGAAPKKKKKDPTDVYFEDLPKPQEKITMLAALTTAPDRSYSPLIIESAGGIQGKTDESEQNNKKKGCVDKSLLHKPLKPSSLPESFVKAEGQAEPKPPSYYFPIIQQNIETEESEHVQQMESKQVKTIERTEEIQSTPTTYETICDDEMQNFAPVFSGFCCTFQNKSDNSLFSVEISTSPPLSYRETPKSQIIAHLGEEKIVKTEKITEESHQVQQEKKHQKSSKQQTTISGGVEKQREEVILKKPLPLASALHKPEALPQYQVNLSETAEAEIQLMQKVEAAQRRHEEKKTITQQTMQNPQIDIELPKQPIKQPTKKPIIVVQEGDTQNAPNATFKPVSDRSQNTTFSPRPRPLTPSMINKPPAIIPYYQSNLVAQQYSAPSAYLLDPTSPAISRSPSPCPEKREGRSPSPFRAASPAPISCSPAPGPPPNPLRSGERLPTPQDSRREEARKNLTSYIPEYKSKRDLIEQSQSTSLYQAQFERMAAAAEQTQDVHYQAKHLESTQDSRYQANNLESTQTSRAPQNQPIMYTSQVQTHTIAAPRCQEMERTDISQEAGATVVQKTSAKQELQSQEMQRMQMQVKQEAGMTTRTKVSEQSHQEQLQALKKSQTQSVEKSSDGLVQVQRKRTVTEEFEHSQKSNVMQIEKNITNTNIKHPFHDINARAIEEQGVVGMHVTNPQPISSRFLQKSPQQNARNVQQCPKTGTPCQEASQTCQKATKQESSQSSTCSKMSTVASSKQESSQSSKREALQCSICAKMSSTASETPETNVSVVQSTPSFLTAPNPPKQITHVSAPPLKSNKSDPTPNTGSGGRQTGAIGVSPRRGRGILNATSLGGVRIPLCASCHSQIRGPFITALGKIWCPDHFICATPSCRRPLQDLGFVEEKGQLYCEYCFEQYLAPQCSKCGAKIKGDCLKAIGKNFHPECFNCVYCGKLFRNSPFFLEDGNPYCEADWNELFTTKCFACGFPVEAGDRWVEALNNNYHSQCFNCTMCKKNLEGQSFFAKGGRPYCKNHAR